MFNSYFNGRLSISERISLINQARLYLFETTLMVAYYWGDAVGAVDILEYVQTLIETDDINEVFDFMTNESYELRAAKYNVLLKDKYHDFLSDVAEQSRQGVDMYKYTAPLFEETSKISFTDYGIVYDSNTSYNLKTLIFDVIS